MPNLPKTPQTRGLAVLIHPTDIESGGGNRRFYRNLARIGERVGVPVIFFSPNEIDWHRQEVDARIYRADQQRWIRVTQPLPTLVYDRYFPGIRGTAHRSAENLARLKRCASVRWLGRTLHGKWQQYQILSGDAVIGPHVPETVRWRNRETLDDRLRSERDLILKPQFGSQGKGVFRIHRREDGCLVLHGRDLRDRPLAFADAHADRFVRRVERLVRGRPYLIQHWLAMQTADGRPFDIRALVQKDRNGRWEFTGMAVRINDCGRVASNLHGGGTAVRADAFLQRFLGESRAQAVMAAVRFLSCRTADLLEQYYGRLVELGLDFGVEQGGNLWLIEANSKPGRTIFAMTNDRQAIIRSISSPISYAKFLLDRQLGG